MMFLDGFLSGSKLKLDKLITDRFNFDEVNQAFQAMNKRGIGGEDNPGF